MVRTAGPTRSTIDASGVWCAASFAIATITCVPSTRSLRVNEAPVPILPMRLEYQVIDEATLPCSGSTAVAANETLTPRSTEAPVAGLVIVDDRGEVGRRGQGRRGVDHATGRDLAREALDRTDGREDAVADLRDRPRRVRRQQRARRRRRRAGWPSTCRRRTRSRRGSVLRMCSPGAATSTLAAAEFENTARWSSCVVAATEMMLGRS